VLGPQWLAQQRIFAQVDLADGEVVGGTPIAMQLLCAFWIESCHRMSPRYRDEAGAIFAGT
jgi:hypothetical protein